MRNLLLLLNRYSSFIVFVFLEIVSIYLIVNYNNRQKEISIYSYNLISGKIQNEYNSAVGYINLKEKNKQIQKENAILLEKCFNNTYQESYYDSTFKKIDVVPSVICNKSIDKRNNRITITNGTNSGIKKGMGVIAVDGIVGVVRSVNEKFASVLPLNNTKSNTSVSIKGKGYFGILTWQPYNYKMMKLESVPKHADVEIGDTVITSGFSTIFPKGIDVGIIKKINDKRGSNYFDIDVMLNNDISLIENVYVIINNQKDLQEEVEK